MAVGIVVPVATLYLGVAHGKVGWARATVTAAAGGLSAGYLIATRNWLALAGSLLAAFAVLALEVGFDWVYESEMRSPGMYLWLFAEPLAWASFEAMLRESAQTSPGGAVAASTTAVWFVELLEMIEKDELNLVTNIQHLATGALLATLYWFLDNLLAMGIGSALRWLRVPKAAIRRLKQRLLPAPRAKLRKVKDRLSDQPMARRLLENFIAPAIVGWYLLLTGRKEAKK